MLPGGQAPPSCTHLQLSLRPFPCALPNEGPLVQGAGRRRLPASLSPAPLSVGAAPRLRRTAFNSVTPRRALVLWCFVGEHWALLVVAFSFALLRGPCAHLLLVLPPLPLHLLLMRLCLLLLLLRLLLPLLLTKPLRQRPRNCVPCDAGCRCELPYLRKVLAPLLLLRILLLPQLPQLGHLRGRSRVSALSHPRPGLGGKGE